MLVAEGGVDIVGDDDEIVLDGDLRDLLHGLHREAAAGGIAGGVNDQGLGPLGNQALQTLHADLKVLLLVGGQLHRNAAGQLHLLGVGGEERGLEDHLVPVVQDGLQGQVHGKAPAGGHKNLRHGDFHVVLFLVEAAYLPPQLRISGKVGVLGVAGLGVGIGFVDNQLVCDEVRVA